MDNATRTGIVCEVVPAARWLIRLAADFPTAQREQQERSDTSVTYECDVDSGVGA
ncbi:hypothetical protein [Mesorhizobium sp. M0977]|uniref:hypothetical protein n=1 Tax=Mesorhizobium sp. M0977 TaxID=2957039 RepID=UPI003335C360